MARKSISISYDNPPKNLSEHPFFGFKLDEEQEKFRDAIWDKEKLVIFCNAKAGTGKTTIATATAELLVKYGLYKGIVYIASPYGEGRQGFLPGSITEKSEVYFEPFYQAIERCGINPFTAICNDTMVSEKYGTGYIKCLTHTYLRGTNFHNMVVILDETQNYDFNSLKKTLTRMSDDCKVIVIGHDKQKDTEDTTNGFVRYLQHFGNSGDSRVAVCKLTHNYRGWISSFADELE